MAGRPVERGRGESFPGLGGPAVAQKYWKWCSRWLLSDPKYACSAPYIPCWGSLRRSPRTHSRMVRGHPFPRFFLSTPSASRSQDIQNWEGVIGPRDVFPGPVVALDGPDGWGNKWVSQIVCLMVNICVHFQKTCHSTADDMLILHRPVSRSRFSPTPADSVLKIKPSPADSH